MRQSEHQHPPTYRLTGDPKTDFKYSIQGFEADINRFLPRDKDAAILDLGCGWGQCLWWLKTKGFTNAQGIDIGSDQATHAVSIGVTVERVDDPTIWLDERPEHFDFVVMNHVIEHVMPETGLALLRAIYGSLRAGGKVVVQTPNMNSLGANAGRYIEISHVTGYTESSLGQVVGLAGFQNINLFGNKTPLTLKPKRLVWKGMQIFSRAIWKAMLFSELGADTPTIIEKNLYAVGEKM